MTEIEKILDFYILKLKELEKRVEECREQRNMKSCIDCNGYNKCCINLKETADLLNEMRVVLGLKIINL
jgi:SPX domain protein involved in polyphosphate accumulation